LRGILPDDPLDGADGAPRHLTNPLPALEVRPRRRNLLGNHPVSLRPQSPENDDDDGNAMEERERRRARREPRRLAEERSLDPAPAGVLIRRENEHSSGA
jgi:hypothetical protein